VGGVTDEHQAGPRKIIVAREVPTSDKIKLGNLNFIDAYHAENSLIKKN
jgi:hypothetical protein